MIEVRLASILVNDQDKARDFYARVLGFVIKRDVPLGAANWLALVASDAPDGIELLLEPAGHPGSCPRWWCSERRSGVVIRERGRSARAPGRCWAARAFLLSKPVGEDAHRFGSTAEGPLGPVPRPMPKPTPMTAKGVFIV